jgi:two-component system, chemotaxis family, protein-glutamate methylesterase/glutaminase
MNSALEEPLRISVLVVDDSAFMRTALTGLINSDSELCTVGTAIDGYDALEKIASLNPDVVTLDVDMPGLDGLGTLRRIMAAYPRPVIIVSSLTEKGAETTVNALCAGAFDCVPKQLSSQSLDIIHIRDDLVSKIKAARSRSQSGDGGARKPPRRLTSPEVKIYGRIPEIVCVGTSTGGPKALQDILPLLPADLSVPILIVQHMPPGFTAPLAQRLNKLCSVSCEKPRKAMCFNRVWFTSLRRDCI